MKRALFIAVFIAALGSSANAAPSIIAGDAWSRPAIGTGVVYLRITNPGRRADRLTAARTPVAQTVELHRSMQANMSMGNMQMNGVMSMQRVKTVVIPAGGSVSFGPGGYHLMVIGLRHDLRPNERFPLRLHFAAAGWTTVTVYVRPN